MREVIADYRTAKIDEKLRTTLAFLEKTTLSPEELGPSDAERALSQGVSREALLDATNVAFVFNLLDRLADTLGWELPPPAFFRRMAASLLKRGYA